MIKETQKGPKTRIVFDGSAKLSNGLNLNDVLMTRLNLQNEMSDILIRFRTYPFIILCDIQKMFVQIQIDVEHKDFQRLLWCELETDAIKLRD